MAATVLAGVLAVVLGLYVLPEFATVRGSEASGSGLPSPEPSGALPGLPLPGGPSQEPGPTTTQSPSNPGAPQSQSGRPSDALANWALGLSRLEIPQVALQAYGYSEMVLARTQPKCRLSWTLLAGIGSVETNHGRHAGAQLLPNGTTQPRITGIPLDGTTTDRITDTDDGKLDGNAQFDQAMGPMQFIPSTWQRWAADADGDKKADPYDIDDAALAAGYYLCANGRDLGTGSGWWAAVLSYNHITRYATKVYAESDRYGRQSVG
jgi:hypothetical protein